MKVGYKKEEFSHLYVQGISTDYDISNYIQEMDRKYNIS